MLANAHRPIVEGVLIDDHLPVWDINEVHGTEVDASREDCWQAVRTTDFGESHIVGLLFRLRGIHSHAGDLDRFIEQGFGLLEEDPPREIVLGLAGLFKGRHMTQLEAPAEGLAALDAPGTIRIAWNFTVDPLGPGRCRVRTETRVHATSPGVRFGFRLYWLVVGLPSGLIRRRMLALIRRNAERSA